MKESKAKGYCYKSLISLQHFIEGIICLEQFETTMNGFAHVTKVLATLATPPGGESCLPSSVAGITVHFFPLHGQDHPVGV